MVLCVRLPEVAVTVSVYVPVGVPPVLAATAGAFEPHDPQMVTRNIATASTRTVLRFRARKARAPSPKPANTSSRPPSGPRGGTR